LSDRRSDFERLSPAKQKLLLARLKQREGRAGKPAGEPRPGEIPPSPLRRTGGPYPLSFSQQRLWFLDRLEPGSAAYNLPDALRLRGRLDPAVLARVLGEIVRRHEVLRTTFGLVAGRPVQTVSPAGPFPLPRVDLDGLPAGAAEREARRLAEEDAALPFDLVRGPHLRARLLRVKENREHVVLLNLHHIVSDGWSVAVLVRELTLLYGAFSAGRPSPLHELPIQYADFADWQHRELTGEGLAGHLRYWRERLAGAPSFLALPTDRPRPAVASPRGSHFRVTLPAELQTALRRVAQREGDTLFMVLLAAFAVVLGRHSGQEDFVVGAPIANRTHKEVEGLIGFFVNTLILRVDLLALGGDGRFVDLLRQVRATTLGAYAHQDFPFERLVEEIQPARDLSYPPLYQVAFALQNVPQGTLTLPGLTFEAVEIPGRNSVVDLTLEAVEDESGLVLDWHYRDLFDRATVERLCAHSATLLSSIAGEPAQPLAGLPLLSAAEAQQVAREWSAGAPAPAAGCLHAAFAAQARRDPAALAVVHLGHQGTQGEERLSYGELAARAGRLARRLAERGIGPEARVAICLPRSVQQVVAVLAVLQAGGAYVPLDPAYPPERLAFMLEDCGARVLVASPGLSGLPAELAEQLGVMVVDPRLDPRLDPGADPRADAESPDLAGSPVSPVSPETTAYVIYTSGSTGRPKGVEVSHRGPAAATLHAFHLLGARPGARQLQLASFSFDAWVLEVFTALSGGATLHLGRPDSLLSGPDLAAQLREERITGAVLPPAVLATLTPGAAGFPDLRFLLTGGERCPAETLERWSESRRFLNAYGPTEASIFVAAKTIEPRGETGLPAPTVVSIGRPIPGARLHVVDFGSIAGRPVPLGVVGELWIGGPLARGYRGLPARTAESFVPDPFSGLPGERLYRSGDLARFLPGGELEILGRTDQQIQLRGFRIEPGEIERVLAEHPAVAQAAVLLRKGPVGPRLVAWVVTREGGGGESSGGDGLAADLRAHLRSRLPAPMIPATFVRLAALPVTANGKLDRAALREPEPETMVSEAGEPPLAGSSNAPRAGLEREIAAVWQEVLGVPRVGAEDNFFDLGGHSLLLVDAQARLAARLGREIPLLELFRHPNVAALARHLEGAASASPGTAHPALPLTPLPPLTADGGPASRAVAILGMAGRFPGAPDLERFWQNLRAGVESISFFSKEELAEAGVDPALLALPNYVPAAGVLAGTDLFDAPFFDVNPREAQLMDPQQRVFLECAVEALDDAGYGAGSPVARACRIGVYAGGGMSEYAIHQLFGNPDAAGGLEVLLGNDKDFLATRVAYKLDLRGPALAVQTACSTSLVAVHLACRALLEGECDVALAGGIGISVPQKAGYLYEEGGVSAADGHNRTFDAQARGTVGSSGAGLVVLKPLRAALADGDPIRAVLRATAITNDGSGKVGFTAPSETGQAAAIVRAQELAGIAPESVQYVEAHGSATPIGDPIEVAALTRAFRARQTGPAADTAGTPEVGFCGFCAIGSVKTNIGHTGSAAGIAGLLKTVLALEHREIPPSLHFAIPNPRLQLEASPFRVATALAPWPAGPAEPGGNATPRRAGVSSFGLGGTNVHVILEEAPDPAPSGPARPWHLLSLSARTASALEAATDRLAAHLAAHPEEELADVAYTLHTGRRGMEHRRTLVCRDREDALVALASRDPRRVLGNAVEAGSGRPVAFVLAGLGEQYPGMARGLYRDEPDFREAFDRAAALFAPHLGADLAALLFPAGEAGTAGEDGREEEPALDLRRMLGRAQAIPEASETSETSETLETPLDRTALLQPAIFALDYALASLLLGWGLVPQAMIGYSLGEYVAACLAGVLSLADAARLVALRARLLDALPAGAMLAVPLAEAELAAALPAGLAIAAVNGPRATVAAGPPAAIEALEGQLSAAGIAARRLRTTHAFHSPLLAPAARPLAAAAREIALHPPRIPYLSNVTGTWITAAEATDPEYWAEHLLRPVRFAAGIAELWREPGRVLVEIGPGASLSALALQLAGRPESDPVALAVLPGAFERRPDRAVLLESLGKLWLAGVEIDWPRVYAAERRRRVSLPSYPFERQRYWIDRIDSAGRATPAAPPSASGLYLPAFRRTPSLPLPTAADLAAGRWLVFADPANPADDADRAGLGTALAARLRARGATVAVVVAGDRFAPGEGETGVFTLDPRRREDYGALLASLALRGPLPTRIVHLWSLPATTTTATTAEERSLGLHSLLSLVHALAARISPDASGPLADLRALIVGHGLARVTAEDPLRPELAPLAALCQLLPRELPGIVCRAVDAHPPASARRREAWLDALLAEILAPAGPPGLPDSAAVALRGAERWVRTFEPLPLPPALPAVAPAGGAVGAVVELDDLADEAKLEETLAAAAGGIAGVLVKAGLGVELPELPLPLATRERLDEILALAAERLATLARLLASHPPGFCLLATGLAARSGAGQLLAAAVDAHAAAFAEEQSERSPFPWAVLHRDEEESAEPAPLPLALRSLLAAGAVDRLVAAPEEPGARIERLRSASAPAAPVAGAAGAVLHARPNLRNPYVPPSTDTERRLAAIWQQLLGLAEVGVHDSFFDLGGDSLLATQVTARVRDTFGVDLPFPILFELSTPASLAERIDQLRPEGEPESAKIARLLAKLDNLSPEEVERMLAERGAGS
jgi:amino acid adenylation domain-containing protein